MYRTSPVCNLEDRDIKYTALYQFSWFSGVLVCKIIMQIIRIFPLYEKKHSIHKRASVTLFRDCWVILFGCSHPPPLPVSGKVRISEQGHSLYWFSCYLAFQKCQASLSCLRKQCNETIASSPQLTIVRHPALGNWLTLCKQFITNLLLVYISQKCSILFS